MGMITGTSGPDVLLDTSGDDTIQGLQGADTITVTGGVDSVDGGSGGGADVLHVDYSGKTEALQGYTLGQSGDLYGFDGALAPDSVVFEGIRLLDVRLGSGADVFGVVGTNAAATLDGGAGDDTFQGDFSDFQSAAGAAAQGLTIELDPTGAQQGFANTGAVISHFEHLDVVTGVGADLLRGAALSDTLAGGQGHNTLYGGGGDDALGSYDGVDLIYGGDGDDTWFGGTATGYISVQPGSTAGDFSVYGGTALHEVENLSVRAGRDSLLVGGGGDDAFYGGYGSNRLTGGLGDDTLATVFNSFDTLDGGGGRDTWIGGYADSFDAYAVTQTAPGAFQLTAYYPSVEGPDVDSRATVTGVEAVDIETSYYDDTFSLLAGQGAVTIAADGGVNTLSIDHSTDTVAETGSYGAFGAGSLAGDGSIAFSQIQALNLKLGSGADSFTLSAHNAGAVYGGGGNDTLTVTPTGAQETVYGGGGDDTLVLDTRGLTGELEIDVPGDAAGMSSPDGFAGFSRNFPDGTFEPLGSVQFTSIEHFKVLGGDGNEAILGPNPGVRPFFADTISAGAGNDFVGLGFSRSVIDLGTGYNGATLDRSNATNDMTFDMPHGTYSGVEGLSGSLNYVETLKTGSGNDSIITGVATGSLFATGDFLNTQIIQAGAGNDTVVSSGDDILAYGGDGVDTIVVDASSDTLGISAFYSATDLSSVTGAGTFTEFSGFEHEVITGGAGKDSLHGGAGDDTLSGGAGADTIDGGAGADVMIGGSGSDTYYVDNPFDQVVEGVGGGTGDVVYTSLSDYGTALNVESLHYTGTGRFHGSTFNGALYADGASSASLLGGDGARLYGGAGDDTLQHRGTGSAQMYGGAGNDRFVVHYGDGTATISGGGGFDLLSYDATLAANLTVDLTKVGFQAIGDGTVIQQIEQLHFTGGAGNDFERGVGAADVLKGAGGADTLIGGGGADILYGGNGADQLYGGDGADTLAGDGGQDVLTGGAGPDTFRFSNPVSFYPHDPAGDDDVVTDFTSGVDKVVIAGFGPGLGAPVPFDVVTSAQGAYEAKATIIVDTANHTLSFDQDGTGDAHGVILLAHGAFTTAAADYMVF